MKTKTISLVLAFVLVANLLLFALRGINSIVFWLVIILCALFAYKVLPKLRK